MPDNLPQKTTNRDLQTLPFAEALEVYSPNLADALPEHIPLQRFKRVVVTAVNQNPELAKADRRSLFNACVTCALDGLYPDGREAVLLVYAGRVSYIPMIAGVRKRMRNSGEVLSAIAEVVHKNDHFRYSHGDRPGLEHEPPALDEDRGPPIGAYAIIRLANGEVVREVMSLREIERIRSFSRGGTKPDSPWVKHWSEMARKTAMKRAAKSAPISSEVERLLGRDDEAERMLPPSPPPPTREQFSEVEIVDDVALEREETKTEPPPVFPFITRDGEATEFDDPENAAQAMLEALRDTGGDRQAIAALWEDNEDLMDALDGAGRSDLADEIHEAARPPRRNPERAAIIDPAPKHSEKTEHRDVGEIKARPSVGGGSDAALTRSSPRAQPDAPVERVEAPQPREAAPIEMPMAFEREAQFARPGKPTPEKLAADKPVVRSLEPPLRNGKPDYRTWRIVLFDAAARRCQTVEDFATLIGDCHEHIEAHDRALPDQAAAFEAARKARMERLAG